VTNWPDYDAALVRRGELTIWRTEEAIAAGPPATGERGSLPIFSAIAVEIALTLRLVFPQPLRLTEGLLRSIRALLDIDIAMPDHTTLSRRRQVDILQSRFAVTNRSISSSTALV
jgi:Transposase DDE domain